MGVVGGIIGRDRNISKRISDGNAKSHQRIDALKDDIHDKFARKDDVKDTVERIETSINGLGAEMRDNHKTLVKMLMKEKH